jgi:hypothetical protein
MKHPILFSIALILPLAACEGGPTPNINTFEECINAGYPIMESYPRRCSVPGGPTFAEEIAPVVQDLSSFTGTLLDVATIGADGNTYFRYQGAAGVESAVLEPEAEFATDMRAIATGSALIVRGWRDEDGVVHAVEIEIDD